MSTAVGRKLVDLRVCDLKDELEKRSLEVTGNKNALIDRLQKALKDEGNDLDTFLFEPLGKRVTPLKKAPVKAKAEEVESEKMENDENGILVDEVGTVDNEDEVDAVDDGENNDADMNDNEESINLHIEEDEQKLLHDQAQDGEKKADDDQTGSNGVAEDDNVIVIKDEDDEEDEEYEEDNEDTAAGNDDNLASADNGAGGDGDAEEEEEEEAEDGIKKDEDDSEQKSSAKAASTKDEKDKTAAGSGKKSATPSSRNLWVSGLSSLTRASDLKTIFSKYGKVIGAKVVTNTRTPGTRCYGYVTMASSGDASRCIEHLHRTELHGRIISVERTKSEIGLSSSSNNTTSASATVTSASKKDDKTKISSRDKKKDDEKDTSKDTSTATATTPKDTKAADGDESVDATADGKKSSETGGDKPKSEVSRRDRKPGTGGVGGAAGAGVPRSTSRGRNRTDRPPRRPDDRDRKRDVLSFQKIREERERQRMRERERELREEDRRRRDIRQRQREEEQRLAKEREKLRMERERLEREKGELLRLERERQKLEREKIELERLELKRQQMKIMQTSRIEETKRSLKRPSDDRYSAGHTEGKRSNTDRRFEAPPPPRFDSALARASDKKRDDYSSSSTKRDDYKRDIDVPPRHSTSNYHSSSRDNHKDSRYSAPEPPRSNFRRDERDNRNSGGNKRFDGPSYVERSSGGGGGGGSSSQWHNPGPPVIKSFAGSQMSNNVPSWQTKSSDVSGGHWRPVDSSQDRYDRTYNERSGPYMDPSRQSSGMFVGGGGRPQDRYGGQMSRY